MDNKVLIFGRVSTETQQLESQVDVLRQYVINRGYDPAQIDDYTIKESALSDIGVNDLRDYQVELLRRLESGAYTTLVVHELSRIARNIIETLKIIDTLKKYHIQLLVYTGAMQMYTDDYSQGKPLHPQQNQAFELQVILLASMAQSEMTIKKERMQRGKKYLQSNGGYIGGNIDYGYKPQQQGNRKMLVIDEAQANNVRRIYDMCIEGYSLNEISQQMIPHNITFAHITKILKNQAYTGLKKTRSNNTKRVPAIITPQQYDQAQQALRSRYIARKGTIYLGSGVLYCYKCGGKINTHKGVSYVCATHHKGNIKSLQYGKTCNNKATLTIDIIDSILVKLALDNERSHNLRDVEKTIERKRVEIEEKQKEIRLCEDNIAMCTQSQQDKISSMASMTTAMAAATMVFISKLDEDIAQNTNKIQELTTAIDTLTSDIQTLSAIGGTDMEYNILATIYEESQSSYNYDWVETQINTILTTIRKHISKVEIHPTSYPMRIHTNRPRYHKHKDSYVGQNGKLYKVVEARELRIWYKGIDEYVTYIYPIRAYNGHTMDIYTPMDEMRGKYADMAMVDTGTAITLQKKVVRQFAYGDTQYRVISVPLLRRHTRVRDRSKERERDRLATANKYVHIPLSSQGQSIIESALLPYPDDMTIKDIMQVLQLSRHNVDRLGLNVCKIVGMKKYYSKQDLYKYLCTCNLRQLYRGAHKRPNWYTGIFDTTD